MLTNIMRHNPLVEVVVRLHSQHAECIPQSGHARSPGRWGRSRWAPRSRLPWVGVSLPLFSHNNPCTPMDRHLCDPEASSLAARVNESSCGGERSSRGRSSIYSLTELPGLNPGIESYPWIAGTFQGIWWGNSPSLARWPWCTIPRNLSWPLQWSRSHILWHFGWGLGSCMFDSPEDCTDCLQPRGTCPYHYRDRARCLSRQGRSAYWRCDSSSRCASGSREHPSTQASSRQRGRLSPPVELWGLVQEQSIATSHAHSAASRFRLFGIHFFLCHGANFRIR